MKQIEELSEKEYAQFMTDNLRSNMQKIESIKNLIKDGKQVVAYEKIQGVGDALAFLLGSSQKRVKMLERS